MPRCMTILHHLITYSNVVLQRVLFTTYIRAADVDPVY